MERLKFAHKTVLTLGAAIQNVLWLSLIFLKKILPCSSELFVRDVVAHDVHAPTVARGVPFLLPLLGGESGNFIKRTLVERGSHIEHCFTTDLSQFDIFPSKICTC